MHMITYVSTARNLFSKKDLEALLVKSRENNARFDITGLLLYKGGNFIQAIEGAQGAIRRLYENIRSDATHYNVLTILDEPVEMRAFTGWRMGFINLDGERTMLPGFSDIFNDRESLQAFRASPSQAKQLISSFAQNMR